jgi:hypothetical protein
VRTINSSSSGRLGGGRFGLRMLLSPATGVVSKPGGSTRLWRSDQGMRPAIRTIEPTTPPRA